MSAVLVVGNLSEGFRVVGPFIDIEEAFYYADTLAGDEVSWGMTLVSPQSQGEGLIQNVAAEEDDLTPVLLEQLYRVGRAFDSDKTDLVVAELKYLANQLNRAVIDNYRLVRRTSDKEN